MELTILIPCLNEAETLDACIKKAKDFIINNNIEGEILIADNGSHDGSQQIATDNKVRIINITNKGYGAALLGGINAASGKFIIMGDADDSYDFSKVNLFLTKLREGYDLVVGNRFAGNIEPGAMPFLHQYLGNPLLSFTGRMLFNTPCKDFHCGLRGFSKAKIINLNLQASGMEFASEMLIKATLEHLKITEVPTKLYVSRRSRPSHLRTWRDGFRHLRLIFRYFWKFKLDKIFRLR